MAQDSVRANLRSLLCETATEAHLLIATPGNKSDLASAPTTNDEFRFNLHKDTSPYSGAKESRAGSGSTGGAGYGNKTGEFAHSGGACTRSIRRM